MPEGYTHVRTAQKAAHAIHYKLQCPAAFAAGANGPDSFFCYEVWKKGQNRTYNLPLLGNRMHEDKTGAFLLALLHHTHTQAQIEYTLGFLCHYAADTVMHPYVVFVSSPGQPYGMKGGHGYFEIALDSTLHAEDTGVSEVLADDSSPVPVGQDLAEIAALLHQCILEVYGQDISVEALADSFYYTYRLRRIFTSRHGVRRAFYWVLELFFGAAMPTRQTPVQGTAQCGALSIFNRLEWLQILLWCMVVTVRLALYLYAMVELWGGRAGAGSAAAGLDRYPLYFGGMALLCAVLRTVPLEQAFYWRSAVCWGFAAVVMVTGGCQWLVSCIKHPA